MNKGMDDKNDYMYHCYNDGFTGATRQNLIPNTEQILYNNFFLKILKKATKVHNLIIQHYIYNTKNSYLTTQHNIHVAIP